MFPGRAVTCSAALLSDPHFCSQLAGTLVRLNSEAIDICTATTKKAGNIVKEERDTTDPALVVDYLMNVLSVLGEDRETIILKKRTRDDVLWSNAKAPWRRAPIWLVLKIAVQRALMSTMAFDNATKLYKSFMALLIARLLELALDKEMPSELIAIVHAKFAQRVDKFEQTFGGMAFASMVDVSRRANVTLSDRWLAVQKRLDVSLPALPTHSWSDATLLSLANSRPKLKQALSGIPGSQSKFNFTPILESRICQDATELPSLQSRNAGGARSLVLADLELWVRNHLQSWTQQCLHQVISSDICDDLTTLIRDYWSLASSQYSESPLEKSEALLVVHELWVALDTLCLSELPLLGEYSPELSAQILNPLLLPKREQMQRLKAIENHIEDRRRLALNFRSLPGVFTAPHARSFSVRYYDTCPELRVLRATIERDDSTRRQAKIEELARLSAKYDRLVRDADGLAETMQMDDEGEEYHDRWRCEKCKLNRAAKDMGIYLHEAFLPKDTVSLKAAVFELAVPPMFAAWRDATWMILHDIGQRKITRGPEMRVTLPNYPQLRGYVQNRSRQPQITLASHTKSFLVAHYRILSFPVTQDKVCVNNGLTYTFWDTRQEIWLEDSLSPSSFKDHCTLGLPLGPYANLCWASFSPNHTANEVLARQDECDTRLQIQEYRAFCSLRSGERIQWINVLRELGCSNLTHNTPAVTALFLQTILEAGSSNGQVLREAHIELQDPSFCRQLFALLAYRVDTIQENWNEQHSMSTVIQLCLRLLSLTSIADVSDDCLKLLIRVRGVTSNWCHQVQMHLHKASNEETVQEKASLQVLSSALLCYSTFDVDIDDLIVAVKSEEDLALAAEMNSIINDSLPGNVSLLPLEIRRSLIRRSKIAYKLEPRIRALLSRHGAGLNKAIEKLWHGASLPTVWESVPSRDGQWVCNRTKPTHNTLSQTVHYSLFSGELLVDGRPSGRVPKEYKRQPFFQRMFGPAVLNVFASDMPGMTHRVTRPIFGNEVHLGLREGVVVIKARIGDRLVQAIPHELLSEDLPIHFVSAFAHWIDEETKDLEFRPLHNLWQPSSDNWRLTFATRDVINASATLRLGPARLVENSSTTGRAITRLLGTLDNPAHVHITLHDAEPERLEVFLHRFNLHFLVTEGGQLLSMEYNAVVDENQSIGTLVGLQSKLVLRDSKTRNSPIDKSGRSVLIPYGQVLCSRDREHTITRVLPQAGLEQRYFVYGLDQYLHKFRGPSDTLGSFYKAYLHAVTSHLLADPLSGRTGTEEAIANLNEASSFVCNPLAEESVLILNEISKLTPKRDYYPRDKKVMQSVVWNPGLPQLSQDDDFYWAAQAILDHNKHFAMLHTNEGHIPATDTRGEIHLLRRAQARHSFVKKSCVDGSPVREFQDVVYSSRDLRNHHDRAKRVFGIAKLVRDWPARVFTHVQLKEVMHRWSRIAGFHHTFKVQSLHDLTAIKLANHWGSLYEYCRSADRNTMTMRMMFLFSAIAFDCGNEDLMSIRTLLAFAFSRNFRDVEPPVGHDAYNLASGWCPEDSAIETAIRRNTNNTWAIESRPPPRVSKYAKSAHIEVKKHELELQVRQFKAAIISQWPAKKVTLGVEHSYIATAPAVAACQALFDEWHKNSQLVEHIETLQARLDIFRDHESSIILPPLNSNRGDFESRSPRAMLGLSILLQSSDRAKAVKIGPPPEKLVSQCSASVSAVNQPFELDSLVEELSCKPDKRRSSYGDVLKLSVSALKNRKHEQSLKSHQYDIDTYLQNYHKLWACVEQALDFIRKALAPIAPAQLVLAHADRWPRITVYTLLNQLSASNIGTVTSTWLAILLRFGESIADLQRSERLLYAALKSDVHAEAKDLASYGRQGWSAQEFPSWLLLEIENNITIRETQAKVALEMIMPSSRKNSVLQLNCGEGKSSVITPMVVSVLADTKRLARVVVLKPLLRQTGQLLSQRLGGLLNQVIYHVPFSRKTNLDINVVEGIQSIYTRCQASRGVVIALPEHILSFRLMSREKMSSDRELAAKILEVDRWLQDRCRDMLDESDEILDTRFQLVYTVGQQQMLDGQPDRWLIAQALLTRVAFHASSLAKQHPDKLDIERKGNSFPAMRFLQSSVGDQLCSLLVKDIMEGQLMGFSLDYFAEDVRNAMERFICNRHVSQPDLDLVLQACIQSAEHLKNLLILRGFMAHGILLFALQRKRWLVEFGLDTSRCLMAVPYRAKGVPSLSSEYGHPDVAILLTCLSYYYTGLTNAQINECFVHLFKDTNAEDIYSRWSHACDDLPLALMNLSGVNLEDELLCLDVLFPQLQFNMEIANYYLTKVVFPREGKEFAKKISASGWDIPSVSPSKDQVTTGFSGTNDNRFLLPSSIRQGDMAELQHTNAMVLDLILRRENRSYVRAANTNGCRLTVPEILSLVSNLEPRVNVLIDVGAQVLDMTNFDVAKVWLGLVPSDEAQAAVYYHESDEAMVLDRSNFVSPLRVSAYRANLSGCLVYLDEVHTRGIDLPIPAGARAAVTLGPRLVKDRLVQGTSPTHFRFASDIY